MCATEMILTLLFDSYLPIIIWLREDLCLSYPPQGRNLALKEEAKQSTKLVPKNATIYGAEHGVDGKLGLPHRTLNTFLLQCTHTLQRTHPWWTVAFSRRVQILWFLLYNRRSKNFVNQMLAFILS